MTFFHSPKPKLPSITSRSHSRSAKVAGVEATSVKVVAKDNVGLEHGRPRGKKITAMNTTTGKSKQRKGQGRVHESFDPKKDVGLDEEDMGVQSDRVEVEQGMDGTSPSALPRAQALLADLIVLPRKPRKGKDGDYEIIPHIPSVIALDDDVTPDLEVDEPWEHIYNPEKPLSNELSYAKVASLK